MTHTKGEWKVDRYIHKITTRINGTQITIAALGECDERVENAKLLAASPDLLEALQDLFNSIDSCVELTPEVLKKAQAAILKATT